MRLFHEYLVTGLVIALMAAVGVMVSDDPELPQKLYDSLFIHRGARKLSPFTVSHVEWSADGQQLMLQARGGSTAAACLSVHPFGGSGYVPQWADALYGMISHATFSADGTSVVLATTTGEVWWIDVETSAATELIKVPQQTPFVTTAISHDGCLMAAATSEGHVYLLEPRRGEVTELPKSLFHMITNVQFSKDARRLLATSTDGSLAVWDTESKSLLHELENKNQGIIAAAVFMPDGDRVMSLCESDLIEIWDIDSKVVQWAGGEGTFGSYGISAIDVCPKGRVAAWSGGLDGRIIIWDLQNQRLIREINNPSLVFKVQLSPDGTRLAVAGREQTVRVYDVMSGRELHRVDVQRIHESTPRT